MAYDNRRSNGDYGRKMCIRDRYEPEQTQAEQRRSQRCIQHGQHGVSGGPTPECEPYRQCKQGGAGYE